MEWPKDEITFPEELRGEPVNVGIDEAGRGCVLGDMVYCAAFTKVGFVFPDEVDDSKQKTPEERNQLFSVLRNLPVGFVTRCIPAAEISAKMLRDKPVNLNMISHSTAKSIIQTIIDAGFQIESAYIDTVGDPGSYQTWMEQHFPSIRFHVEKKADANYKIVGAASIHAKVLRDTRLESFEFEETGINFERNWGSGYPSDREAVAWLEQNFNPVFGYPSLVRFSWRPIEQSFVKNKVEAEFESNPKVIPGSSYFSSRCLRSLDKLRS